MVVVVVVGVVVVVVVIIVVVVVVVFLPNISPHKKLHPNCVKKDFVIGWCGLVGLVGQKMAVTISNLLYTVFCQFKPPRNLVKKKTAVKFFD